MKTSPMTNDAEGRTPAPITPSVEPLVPSRVRVLPRHFAWADHRLREHLCRMNLEEIALLFFLHLAADRQGCSFWADSTVGRKLGLPEGEVIQARYGLEQKGYIAYAYPRYQLLELPGGARP